MVLMVSRLPPSYDPQCLNPFSRLGGICARAARLTARINARTAINRRLFAPAMRVRLCKGAGIPLRETDDATTRLFAARIQGPPGKERDHDAKYSMKRFTGTAIHGRQVSGMG